MSVAQENITNSVISEDRLSELSKKYYGLTDKDISELMVFIDEFHEAGNGVAEDPVYEDLKPIVDVGNKIPSHCGFLITSYYANRNGDDALISLMTKLYNVFTVMNEDDPESTKTTDLYETLACLILFSQHDIVRKFITNDFERAKDVMKIMRKRPAVSAVLMSCMSELYMVSKDKQQYADCITENLQQMLAFLETKNGITKEVPDAVNVNFNDLRDIMSEYMDAGNKKESLTQINNLINKKADIGQAFFNWIVANPSVACNVIESTSAITDEMLVKFLKQMKVQHVIETILASMNYIGEKLNKTIIYIKEVYKLENIDDYYSRLQKIVQKGGMFHYGVLLRNIELMPKIEMNGEIPDVSSIKSLQRKLSIIENNLTADISEKSMSITIAPLGRSRVYQDIYDALSGISDNGEEGGSGGFVAKLRDKNIVKKIRESGLSYFAVDQYCGSNIIKMLESAIEVLENSNLNISNMETFLQETYKVLVLKYKLIQTQNYFKTAFDVLCSDSDEDDDYEDVSA